MEKKKIRSTVIIAHAKQNMLLEMDKQYFMCKKIVNDFTKQKCFKEN